MLPLGLDDRIETDAPFRQGIAQRRSSAWAIGNMPHRQLGLIAVEGDATHFGLVRAAQLRVRPHLRVRHIEGLLHGLQSFATGGGIDHTTHLHFAGGDQPQVDFLLRKAVEKAGCDAGAPHDPRTTDAEFRQTSFRGQFSPEAVEHRLAHAAGMLQV